MTYFLYQSLFYIIFLFLWLLRTEIVFVKLWRICSIMKDFPRYSRQASTSLFIPVPMPSYLEPSFNLAEVFGLLVTEACLFPRLEGPRAGRFRLLSLATTVRIVNKWIAEEGR